MYDRSKDIKYFLLKADLFGGDGDVTPQPWVKKCTDLMVADLCKDRKSQIESFYDKGFEDWHAWLDKLSKEEKLKRPINVIQFFPYLYKNGWKTIKIRNK